MSARLNDEEDFLLTSPHFRTVLSSATGDIVVSLRIATELNDPEKLCASVKEALLDQLRGEDDITGNVTAEIFGGEPEGGSDFKFVIKEKLGEVAFDLPLPKEDPEGLDA